MVEMITLVLRMRGEQFDAIETLALQCQRSFTPTK